MVYDDAWEDLPNGFNYWIGNHRQEITFGGPFQLEAESGLEGWIVQIKTDYLQRRDSEQSVDLQPVNDLAKSLCFSSLVLAEDNSSIQLGCSVVVHEGNQDWITLPLIQSATHQFLQCLNWPKPAPELASVWEPLQTDSPTPGQPDMAATLKSQVEELFNNTTTETPEWFQEEINRTASILESPPCVLCTGDESGLTAEFPFLDRTQLLTVTHQQHGDWGNGIMIQLRLPLHDPPQESMAIAEYLCQQELGAITPGVTFGPWFNEEAPRNTTTATHFIPYPYLKPNLVTNYIFYFVARARWVNEMLNDFEWSDSFATVAKGTEERIERVLEEIDNDPQAAAERLHQMIQESDTAESTSAK